MLDLLCKHCGHVLGQHNRGYAKANATMIHEDGTQSQVEIDKALCSKRWCPCPGFDASGKYGEDSV